MKSVPSSSWRALLILFRIRGARVDPRPCRLQGESDIFVWTGQSTWRKSGKILRVEKVKTLQEVILLNTSTSVDNWEGDSLRCSLRRHLRCPSPPSPEQRTRNYWSWYTAADHHLRWKKEKHLVLCQHVNVEEQKEDKEDFTPAEEKRQVDLVRPHDSPSSLCHSSQDSNQMISMDQFLECNIFFIDIFGGETWGQTKHDTIKIKNIMI